MSRCNHHPRWYGLRLVSIISNSLLVGIHRPPDPFHDFIEACLADPGGGNDQVVESIANRCPSNGLAESALGPIAADGPPHLPAGDDGDSRWPGYARSRHHRHASDSAAGPDPTYVSDLGASPE
jgi:hypothetical protein